MIRRYSRMYKLPSFDERFNYLRLQGSVGRQSFGFDRYLNQAFYKSREWKQLRDFIITRDNGCDLGVEGYEIHRELLVHHMNPMGPEAIKRRDPKILDPEYLITTTHRTHNAIHYGGETYSPPRPIQRIPGDTKLW
jgi:hypothetical protein